MITVRKNYERGATELGRLHSKHTSFGDYYDPCYQGVSALRAINDDHVGPEKGFLPHFHRDMEIINYVAENAIEHKYNLGITIQSPCLRTGLCSAIKSRPANFNS